MEREKVRTCAISNPSNMRKVLRNWIFAVSALEQVRLHTHFLGWKRQLTSR